MTHKEKLRYVSPSSSSWKISWKILKTTDSRPRSAHVDNRFPITRLITCNMPFTLSSRPKSTCTTGHWKLKHPYSLFPITCTPLDQGQHAFYSSLLADPTWISEDCRFKVRSWILDVPTAHPVPPPVWRCKSARAGTNWTSSGVSRRVSRYRAILKRSVSIICGQFRFRGEQKNDQMNLT